MNHKTPKASMNALIEFMKASQRRKSSIVKEQQRPVTFIVAHYATARAAMKDYIREGYDITSIYRAVKKLQQRESTSKWVANDIQNSILALRQFVNINFPKHVGKIHCQFSKPQATQCTISGVQVNISPDLILRWEENGQKRVGAIKFRIGKKPLRHDAGQNAAALLAHYLQTTIVHEDETVDHAHCLFVNIMASSIYPAPQDISLSLHLIHEACMEYSTLWYAA